MFIDYIWWPSAYSNLYQNREFNLSKNNTIVHLQNVNSYKFYFFKKKSQVCKPIEIRIVKMS